MSAVRRDSLSSLALKEILARIAQGVYPVGKRLPSERAMAAELGVSRITLRRSLAGLRRLGVLSTRRGSGNYVRAFSRLELPTEIGGGVVGFDARALRDVIEARRAIETAIAALAARRRSRKDIADLKRQLEAMRDHVEDLPRFVVADMGFHEALARSSGNRVLAGLLRSISEQQRFSQVFTGYGAGEQAKTVAFHDRIFSAIERGEPRAAARAMSEHLDDMQRYVKRRRRSV